MLYTLHFGIAAVVPDRFADIEAEGHRSTIAGILSEALMDRSYIVYVDGDSFTQWGEAPQGNEVFHAQVTGAAKTAKDAWNEAVFLAALLVFDQYGDAGPLDLGASADLDKHTPFAVTLAGNWGAVIGIDGARWGDPDAWDEADLLGYGR